MSAAPNTLYLRLEGPMQAWGDNSRFVVRRTMDAPTKSGVLGLICCAMGLTRAAARDRLPDLNALAMGVRIDRAGDRWWDYHTAGAGIGLLQAKGGIKETKPAKGVTAPPRIETLLSRREYLCDASFLVALQGESELIAEVSEALASPRWPVFLGRKSCPPAVPIPEGEDRCGDLRTALKAKIWRPRHSFDAGARQKQVELPCIVEWQPSETQPTAPPEAEVWYDRPVSFDPPVHEARLVMRETVSVDVGGPVLHRTPAQPRPHADYRNTEYKKRRLERLEADHQLCVFCKSPATTTQHITYRRAGGGEELTDLRSLCRLCHDAVTMIEYGLGMGLDRINPEDPEWRDRITAKRSEIVEFRSLETRRRRFAAEEVE
jgi:CRISPR system Cascade subunit CasD